MRYGDLAKVGNWLSGPPASSTAVQLVFSTFMRTPYFIKTRLEYGIDLIVEI